MYARIAILLIGFWCSACLTDISQEGCTEMGCEDVLTVAVQDHDEIGFDDGEFTFVFLWDTNLLEKQCTLQADNLDCQGSDYLEVNFNNGVFTTRLYAAPEALTIEVYGGQQLLGQPSVQPDYSITTPNGADCGPVCYQGSVDIFVDLPAGS